MAKRKYKQIRILKFFENKETPIEFETDAMYRWMNLNKNAEVTRQELPQLLRIMGGFVPVAKAKNQISLWRYEGE
jgi:hypothetical protein